MYFHFFLNILYNVFLAWSALNKKHIIEKYAKLNK